MPELPEVETIKRYLERDIKGKKIKAVKILNKKSFLGKKNKILNSKILKIERAGKILIIRLDNSYLVFHLKLTGQLLYLKSLENLENNRYTRVIFVLDKGFLVFNDARKFAWVKVLDNNDLEKELSKLGKEPFEINFEYFKNIFSKTKRPIKLVLMDQTKIAGIGNIYANEALFLGKIHPLKPANKLKDKEIKNLLCAIKKVIQKAIKLQGTSFRFYVKPDKSKGNYQEEFLVYQRKGEKCLRCKNKIEYIKIGGRGSFYCPSCQKWKV